MKFIFGIRFEITLFIVGLLLSAGLGSLCPLSMTLFADIVDVLIKNLFLNAPNLIEKQIPLFVQLAVASLILGFIQMYFLNLSSKRQARRIRLLFFQVRCSVFLLLANNEKYFFHMKIVHDVAINST